MIIWKVVKKMPILIKGDMQIAFMKASYKRYGIYLFEKPNCYVKVATFISDESVDKFMDYIIKMFDIIEEKENEENN